MAGINSTTIQESTTDPVANATGVRLYVKDVAGVKQLFTRASDGTISQVGSGGGGTNPAFIPLAGRASHALDTPPLIVGGFEFTRSNFTATTIKFRAVAAKGNAIQANVQLYNVTDSVSVAILNFTSAATALQVSADITGSLPLTSRIYEVRIYLNAAPGGSDSVELYSAALEINP
jgi:hypothetical protein